jgi:hypothetical protein
MPRGLIVYGESAEAARVRRDVRVRASGGDLDVQNHGFGSTASCCIQVIL